MRKLLDHARSRFDAMLVALVGQPQCTVGGILDTGWDVEAGSEGEAQ